MNGSGRRTLFVIANGSFATKTDDVAAGAEALALFCNSEDFQSHAVRLAATHAVQ